MKTLSMTIDHRRVFIGFSVLLSVLMIAITFLSALTNFFLDGAFENEKFFFIMSFMCYNGFMTVCMLIFNFIVYCFALRFSLINSSIRKYFTTEDEDDGEKQGKKFENLSEIVMKLADLHDVLVDATVEMNKCFSLQMMNVIAGLFMINITSTFAIYRVFVQNDDANFNNAILQYAWNIYFLYYLLSVISLTSAMTRNGKFTAVLVHKAINFTDDVDDPIIDYVS